MEKSSKTFSLSRVSNRFLGNTVFASLNFVQNSHFAFSAIGQYKMSQTFNSVSLWKNSCFLDGLGILLCDYHIAMQFHRVGFPSTKSAFLKSELSGLANVQPHPPRSVFPSSGGACGYTLVMAGPVISTMKQAFHKSFC